MSADRMNGSPPPVSPLPPRSRAHRLARATVLPEGRYGVSLAVLSAVDAFGSGMFLAGAAIYFTRVVGLSVAAVGLGLSVAGMLGFVAAIPIGMLADRVGAGRVYVAMNGWRAACYVGYCFCDRFSTFLLIACAVGLVETSASPINQAVVGAASDDSNRLTNMARVRSVRNVGYGLGALASVMAVSTGSRAAFVVVLLVNAASFLVAAILLVTSGFTVLASTGPGIARRTVVGDLRYVASAACNGVLAVHLTLLPFAFPLWISQHSSVPIGYYGIFYALNTVLAILLQTRVSRRAESLAGAGWCAVLAAGALIGFGLLAVTLEHVRALWPAVALAVLATVALTFGEMWQSASGWSISYLLARPERRSQYLSTFQLGTSAQAIFAPLLLGRYVLSGSAIGWGYLAVLLAVAGLVLWRLARPASEGSPQ